MEKKNKLKRSEKRIEREILKLLIFMAAIVVIFIIVNIAFRSLNEFNYQGLHFKKEKAGNLEVYHYYYFFKDATGKTIQYNLFLRNDPRENLIPIDGSAILFNRHPLYITVKTAGLIDCSDNVLAIGDLARFLGENGIKVKSGNMDFVEAATASQEYVTCENKPDNDVIQVVYGNETRIDVSGDCATITIGPKCDMLPAVEKFKIQSIIDKKKDDLAIR